jgi:two-component system cell cycle response regulator DivK
MPTILLVEDNDLNRDMLSRRLSRRGYDVEVAVDGAEALEKARAVAPDLVLMDMSLPVLDGWAATRQLRASDDTRDIPVIALTAHAMAEDRGKALDAGCDDFDTKPVEFARLLGKIEALLNRGSQVGDAAGGGAEDAGESASAATDEGRSGGGGTADAP